MAERQQFQSRRALRGELLLQFFERQDLTQFEFDDLLAADDAERQRQREHEARFGVEALRVAERQGGAAQHALEGAHQVVVAQEAQLAALLEADADLVEGADGPRSGPTAEEHAQVCYHHDHRNGRQKNRRTNRKRTGIMIWVARALAAVTVMMLIYALIFRFWAY